MQPIIPCLDCLHLKLNKQRNCFAFLDTIPDEILLGDNKHLKPLKNQKNDIVFERKG